MMVVHPFDECDLFSSRFVVELSSKEVVSEASLPRFQTFLVALISWRGATCFFSEGVSVIGFMCGARKKIVVTKSVRHKKFQMGILYLCSIGFFKQWVKGFG
jgi:hypothetical protein